jgi:cytochrome c biogenesis protein CcdA/thiol-disulfide isomerase/thioredoxin
MTVADSECVTSVVARQTVTLGAETNSASQRTESQLVVGLVAIGLIAGLVAGISPCILPVLPVVLVAGATTPDSSGVEVRKPRRPIAVVAGLVLSFSLLILAGSELLSLLHLPQDSLRDAGIAVLVIIGIGFLVPGFGTLLERPFAKIRARQPSGEGGGFVLGLALGLLFVPCAGPVLAAITVVGATHRVGLTAVAVTFAFAVGAAVPLLLVALAGDKLAHRVKMLRDRASWLRRIGGAVLIVMALAIGFNTFASLQRDVPGYTSSLQNRVEGSNGLRKQLGALTGNGGVPLAKCPSTATKLVSCGRAPAFTKITAWLNTPDGKPLSIAGLRGKVLLVDFWTYSCINCQRTLPHVEAWYQRYERYGLVVVGVSTPEFAFEHVVSNVRAAASELGVHYPVAIDDDYGTWDAYDNEYWPAEYLVDATGVVRHIDFGEGNYSVTEGLIRQLLTEAHPGVKLPPPTTVPNLTPTAEINPETYVGYERVQYLASSVTQNAPATYHFPSSLQLGAFGLSGVWTDRAEEATAGAHAELELGFQANDIYLVLGGKGTLDVSTGAGTARTIDVSGIPRLYTLLRTRSLSTGTLLLHVSPGVQVYDFTFG